MSFLFKTCIEKQFRTNSNENFISLCSFYSYIISVTKLMLILKNSIECIRSVKKFLFCIYQYIIPFPLIKNYVIC